MQNVDIVIIGGGMIGLALACGLMSSGLCVVVIEKEPSIEARLYAVPKSRVSVINVATKKLFNYLGVWSEIIAGNTSCFRSLKVWGKDGFNSCTFDSRGTGYIYLGYIIENEVIRNILWKKACQYRNITILTSTIVQKIEWNENEVFITCHTGNKLAARLLIGADGKNSLVRREAGIPVAFWNYRHHALIATIRTTETHKSVVRQIFQNDDILAFLPLKDPYLSSIVWSLNPDKAKQIAAATPEIFNQELCIAFDNQLGLCFLESERKVFPLVGLYARYFAGHRLALVGDAAHTIHPLAGQGVNLGFMDVIELLGELRKLQCEKKDIGQHLYLRRYELNRKYNVAIMLASIHGIRKIFSGGGITKKMLRDISMKLADSFPNIKLRILRRAMGIYDIPKWLHE